MRPQLRQLIVIDLLGCLAFALPCIVLPPSWFALVGLDIGEAPAALAFTRLFGAVLATVCVAYILHLWRPGLDHIRFVALAANLFISAVLWVLIFQGRLLPLPFLGKVLLTGAAIVTAVFAALILIATSRPPQPPGLASALDRRSPSALPTDSENTPAS